MKKTVCIISLLVAFAAMACAQGTTSPRTKTRSFFSFSNAGFSGKETKTGGRIAKSAITASHGNGGGRRGGSRHAGGRTGGRHGGDSVALYMNCVRQNGWMRGLGEPLTPEHAARLGSYLRFSRKDRNGHWTRMEFMNGYGRHDVSHIGTYLMNPAYDNDRQLDKEWKDMLEHIASVEFVGDKTGMTCVQENAYGRDGRLVYSLTFVPVGKDKVMGHYVDAWGMPALMRGSYGARYVVIQRDRYGYDADVSYIGTGGFPEATAWGGYSERRSYDRDGMQLSSMSCNADGSPMAGSCGWKASRDKYGNMLSCFSVDGGGSVTAMTVTGGTAAEPGDTAWTGKVFDYDGWGRLKSVRYVSADGSPDTLATGVHGTACSYDTHGQTVLTENFGIDGRPHDDAYGICTYRRLYDDGGHETLLETRNARGQWANRSGKCLQSRTYDGGVLVDERTYATNFGTDTVLTCHFCSNGDRKVYVRPQANETETYVYDSGGRETEHYFTSLSGRPRQNVYEGYCSKTTRRSSAGGVCVEETEYRDTLGRYADVSDGNFRRRHFFSPYNHSVTVVDSGAMTRTVSRYDGERLLRHYRQHLKDDLTTADTEQGLDIMGEPARTHLESALYYDSHVGYNIKGGQDFVEGINEYGEPAYITSSDSRSNKAYGYFLSTSMSVAGLSLLGRELDVKGSGKGGSRALPCAYIIEVSDSVAYDRWGIRSGDVIMEYGGWTYPELTGSKEDGQRLAATMFELFNKEKTMTVMRRNPHTNKPEVHDIRLGKGTPADLGFFFFSIYSTDREARRYRDAYSAHLKAADGTQHNHGQQERKEKAAFMRPYRANAIRQYAFNHGLEDNAIVLGMVTYDNYGRKDLRIIKAGDLPRYCDIWHDDDARIRKIWYTTDMVNIRTIVSAPSKKLDAYIWVSPVDGQLAEKCRRLYKACDKDIDAYVAEVARQLHDDSIMASGHGGKQ